MTLEADCEKVFTLLTLLCFFLTTFPVINVRLTSLETCALAGGVYSEFIHRFLSLHYRQKYRKPTSEKQIMFCCDAKKKKKNTRLPQISAGYCKEQSFDMRINPKTGTFAIRRLYVSVLIQHQGTVNRQLKRMYISVSAQTQQQKNGDVLVIKTV